VTVRKFEVHAITIGEDAQGEAILYVESDGRSYRGSSISTNIIEAAGRALLEVINRIELSHSSAARNRSNAARREDIARLAQSAV
jgi:2-isopropylmalate synthase